MEAPTDVSDLTPIVEPDFITAFEALDKWTRVEGQEPGFASYFVYEKNLARAENNGFPSSLARGEALGLTRHEVAALFGWTTGDFRFVNAAARGVEEIAFEDYVGGANVACKLAGAEVLPYVQVIGTALEKLPPASAGRLWRGHHRPMCAALGSVLELEGFASATYDSEEALRFAAQFPGPGKSTQRTLLAIEEHRSGRSIAPLSARRGELEVLFPRNTRFEVVDRPADGDGSLSAVEAAMQQAALGMQQHMPDAEISILHIREIQLVQPRSLCGQQREA